MGLPSLFNLPMDPVVRSKWSFNNADLHIRTNQRIFNLNGLRLSYYQLDPMPEGKLFDQWLQLHQDIHNQTHSALGTAGNDLTDVDFGNEQQLQAWVWLHQREHLAWEIILGSSLG